MVAKPSGSEIMDKPLPALLDEIIANADRAEQAAAGARSAADEAVRVALEGLMADTINPLVDRVGANEKATADSNALASAAMTAANKAQLSADGAAKLAKTALDTGNAAAALAQSARDAYNALQAEHNDLVDKFNDQVATVKAMADMLSKMSKQLSDIMLANVNSSVEKANYYLRQYRVYGIKAASEAKITAPVA